MPRRQEGRDLPEIVTLLFEAAQSRFPDPRAVNRSLVELSKLYDPVSGGPVIDHTLRRHIVECLEAGRVQDATQALQARFQEYRQSFGLPGTDS
jgi:hypothetical protein